MPSVLMLVENRPAPSDARVWPEALALRGAGFTVSVISPKGETAYRDPYVCIDGIYVYRYSLRTGDNQAAYLLEYASALLKTAWLSMRAWREHRFDVIHAANPPDIFFVIAWFFKPLGVRFVFDQHDLSPETFQSRFEGRKGLMRRVLGAALRVCEKCTYRTADLVIVTNESFRRIAIERGGRAPESVVVVRNGPSLKRWASVEPHALPAKRWPFVLAYVGEMAAQDGVDNALRALDILVHVRGRQDVGLLLVGTGTSVPSLRALTRELQLEEHVHFAGWVGADQVADYLRIADIGLSPEPRNAMNDASTMIKVMEYMAAGKPVVAFDLRETRFSAQDAALYAEPGNPADFAAKIDSLLTDEARRAEMGEIGRARVRTELNWEQSQTRLLAAYDWLFRDRGRT